MGTTRIDFDKTSLIKPKYIPVTESVRANGPASGEELKSAMAELNTPTVQEQAFLDEFAK
jgi:hypothetical protein